MTNCDLSAMAKTFESMAVEEDGVRKLCVPAPECMVWSLQFCGYMWESPALQEAVAALYERMEWSKSRSFTWEEFEKVVACGILGDFNILFKVILSIGHIFGSAGNPFLT